MIDLRQGLKYAFVQKHPPEVFYKKAAFKNFEIFTGKHLCWCLFLIKWKIISKISTVFQS